MSTFKRINEITGSMERMLSKPVLALSVCISCSLTLYFIPDEWANNAATKDSPWLMVALSVLYIGAFLGGTAFCVGIVLTTIRWIVDITIAKQRVAESIRHLTPEDRKNLVELAVVIGKSRGKTAGYLPRENQFKTLQAMGILNYEFISNDVTLDGMRHFVAHISSEAWSVLRPMVKKYKKDEELKRKQQAKTKPRNLIHDFENRMVDAFPGELGLSVLDRPRDIRRAVEYLFQEPLSFRGEEPYGEIRSPMHWYRGSGFQSIPSFEWISRRKLIVKLGNLRIKLKRVAGYRSMAYYHEFVYFETDGEKPTRFTTYQPDRARKYKDRGYPYSEEYGVHRRFFCLWRRYFSFAEISDGAAVRGGRNISLQGISREQRILSPYNFLVLRARSTLNNDDEDVRNWTEILNGILEGTHTLDDLVTFVDGVRKKELHDTWNE